MQQLQAPPQAKRRIDTNPNTINVIEYKFSSFSASTIGTSVNIAFPRAKKIGSYQFSVNAAIIGVSLTTSISNPNAALAGVFVLTDAATDTCAIENDVNCIISHTTWQNATATIPVSANRTNGMVFGDNTAMKINASQRLGIYMCCANDATVFMLAVVNLTWIPITR